MSNARLPKLTEHLSLRSEFSLREFCVRFRAILNLPPLSFDCENETEWGLVVRDGVEYNVSRPYEEGTLEEWDDTVPLGCNFGIGLSLLRGHPHLTHERAEENLVAPVGQALATEFATEVHLHRTWLGVGNNVRRHRTFHPRDGESPRFGAANLFPPPQILLAVRKDYVPAETLIRWAKWRLSLRDEQLPWMIELAAMKPETSEVVAHLEKHGACEAGDGDERLALLAYGFFAGRTSIEEVHSHLSFRYCSLSEFFDFLEMPPLGRQAIALGEKMVRDPVRARQSCGEILQPYREQGERLVADFLRLYQPVSE
jgi:hypothetical protein